MGFYLNVENQTFLYQNRFPIHNLEYTDYVDEEEVEVEDGIVAVAVKE